MVETIAIHQPNFFPWLGFFDKLVRADRLVLLDNVQYQKKGGTWSNRVRICVSGEARWLTAPVDRAYHGVRSISQMRFAESEWRERIIATVRQTYQRARHFDEMAALVEPFIRNPAQSVSSYNETAIAGIAQALGIRPEKIIRATDLTGLSGTATELLVSIVKAAGGNAYLSGDGAGGYQHEEAFLQAGVQLRMQQFRHPTYRQIGAQSTAFQPGMSVIDVLANIGVAGTRELLVGGSP
jgi:hypothetical protein